MNKVLILTRKEDRASFDQKKTYESALSRIDANAEYTVDEFEDLVFTYDGEHLSVLLQGGVIDIASFDAVFLVGWFKTKMLEDLALSVSIYLVAKGVTVLNSEALYTRSRSKLSQYVYAALNDISVTPFIFSVNPTLLRDAISNRWQHEYPVIMKGVLSSRGNDNYKIYNETDLMQKIDETRTIEAPWFVIQQFIPNDGDYRIIVMGNKVVAAIHRQSVGPSHLNNTSKGGEAKLIDVSSLPNTVCDESVELARLLRREIAGVDMIQHKDSGMYYLLEINNMPQLATGTYVNEKIQALDTYFRSVL